MIETYLGRSVRVLCNEIGRYSKGAFNPNSITFLGFIIGVASGISIACNFSTVGVVLLWISGFCDVMDGTVARLSGKVSSLGSYFDLIADRMVESALMVGFCVAYPQSSLYCIFFMVALLFHFSTFLVAGALFPNSGHKSMHYDKSMVERVDAFIIFSMLAFFPEYIVYILMPLNAFIIVDGILRFIRVVKAHS